MISRELLFALSDDEKAILIFIFNEKYDKEVWTLDCLCACRLEPLRERLKAYAFRIEEEHKALYISLCAKFGVTLPTN